MNENMNLSFCTLISAFSFSCLVVYLLNPRKPTKNVTSGIRANHSSDMVGCVCTDSWCNPNFYYPYGYPPPYPFLSPNFYNPPPEYAPPPTPPHVFHPPQPPPYQFHLTTHTPYLDVTQPPLYQNLPQTTHPYYIESHPSQATYAPSFQPYTTTPTPATFVTPIPPSGSILQQPEIYAPQVFDEIPETPTSISDIADDNHQQILDKCTDIIRLLEKMGEDLADASRICKGISSKPVSQSPHMFDESPERIKTVVSMPIATESIGLALESHVEAVKCDIVASGEVGSGNGVIIESELGVKDDGVGDVSVLGENVSFKGSGDASDGGKGFRRGEGSKIGSMLKERDENGVAKQKGVVKGVEINEGHEDMGLFGSVMKVFDEMPVRDVPGWNAVLSCYYHDGQWEKVYEVQIAATPLHAPNSLVFHVESIGRALTTVSGNGLIKNDKVMVYKLHENEYGKFKFKDMLGNKLGLDDLRGTKLINSCTTFKSKELKGKVGDSEAVRSVFMMDLEPETREISFENTVVMEEKQTEIMQWKQEVGSINFLPYQQQTTGSHWCKLDEFKLWYTPTLPKASAVKQMAIGGHWSAITLVFDPGEDIKFDSSLRTRMVLRGWHCYDLRGRDVLHGRCLRLEHSSLELFAVLSKRASSIIHTFQAQELVVALPDLCPGSVVPLLLQAAVLVGEDKAGKAEEILRHFAEKFPENTRILHLARAQVAVAAGHPQIAVAPLHKPLLFINSYAKTLEVIPRQLGDNAGIVDKHSSIWEENSFQLGKLQRQEPSWSLSFTPTAMKEKYLAASLKLKVAVIREEENNGDWEISTAFNAAGCERWDVTMSDVLTGVMSLDKFCEIVFVRGLSYADVLDSAKGWCQLMVLLSLDLGPRVRGVVCQIGERITIVLGKVKKRIGDAREQLNGSYKEAYLCQKK